MTAYSLLRIISPMPIYGDDELAGVKRFAEQIRRRLAEARSQVEALEEDLAGVEKILARGEASVAEQPVSPPATTEKSELSPLRVQGLDISVQSTSRRSNDSWRRSLILDRKGRLKRSVMSVLDELPRTFTSSHVRDVLDRTFPGLTASVERSSIAKVLARLQNEQMLDLVSPGRGKRPPVYSRRHAQK